MPITTQSFTGPAAHRFIPDLARLRIEIFREFPYLYEGTAANEEEYLQTFIEAPDSVLVIAFDGNRVIGASTALPMESETENIQAPWLEKEYDLQKIFYYGESVLEKAYRGRGIGSRFFEHRERWARELGRFELLTFCGVIRPEDHLRRPDDFVPLDRFWQRRGFQKADGMICYISWQDLDEQEESPKPLQFWKKRL